MSSARTEILRRVRSALADVAPAHREPAAQGHDPHPDGPDEATIALFLDRVADYRADVVRCDPSGAAAAVTAALGDARRVVLPPGLPDGSIARTGTVDFVTDDGLSTAELDDFDAVVTTARLGIAETGTIVLDHGPGQGRRALTLVPDRHVCIIEASQVVADVSAAMRLLDPRCPLTWISGPSATSDIELQRWRFHMTLTRRLAPDEHTLWRQAAERHFAAALAHSRRVTSLCLFTQTGPGAPFLLAERIRLG